MNRGDLPSVSSIPPYWGVEAIPFLVSIPSMVRLHTVARPFFSLGSGNYLEVLAGAVFRARGHNLVKYLEAFFQIFFL